MESKSKEDSGLKFVSADNEREIQFNIPCSGDLQSGGQQQDDILNRSPKHGQASVTSTFEDGY